MSYSVTSDQLRAPQFRLTRKRNRWRWLRRLAWTVCTLAAMAGTTQFLLNPPQFLLQKPQAAQQATEQWTEIRRPIPIYSFTGGPFERDADHYAAKRHSDGSRIDTMTFGKFAAANSGTGDWMRVQMQRLAGAGAEAPAFFIEMVRLASGEGLSVTGNTFPGLVATRFGDFAVSDLEISNGKSHAKCLGYRMQLAKPAFRISGIACGPPKAPIDRRMLSCILNRLDVTSSRDDKELGRFFAQAELQRQSFCGPAKLVGFRNRAAWLDQVTSKEAVGALRLSSLPASKLRR